MGRGGTDQDALGRVATVLTVSFNNGRINKSRSCALRQPYKAEGMISDIMALLAREFAAAPGQAVRVGYLYVTATAFRVQNAPGRINRFLCFWLQPQYCVDWKRA